MTDFVVANNLEWLAEGQNGQGLCGCEHCVLSFADPSERRCF